MLDYCLTCNKPCHQTEMDEFKECFSCQDRFLKEMSNLRGKTNKNQINLGYISNIPVNKQVQIMEDAARLYKIKYTAKSELIQYINRKYKVSLNLTAFNKLCDDKNFRKYDIEWEYLIES